MLTMTQCKIFVLLVALDVLTFVARNDKRPLLVLSETLLDDTRTKHNLRRLSSNPNLKQRLHLLASRLHTSAKEANDLGSDRRIPEHAADVDSDPPTGGRQSGWNRTSSRQGRFFSLFNFVTAQKQPCNSSRGDNGTCYGKAECIGLGGIPSGFCVLGFSTCCVFARSCGAVMAHNGAYFINPNSPKHYDGTGSCQFTVVKCHKKMCYLRLAFDVLTLAPPSLPDHICLNDQFVIAGGSPAPILCGQNSGNHMLVDASGTNNAFTITIITSGTSFQRSWKIKITQLECDSAHGYPGCQQYFLGVTGKIMSYNYDPGNGMHLSSQDYSICIRKEAGFCGIQYKVCGTPPNAPGQTDAQKNIAYSISSPPGGGMMSQVGEQNCMQDWIIIPCATNVANSLIQDDQQTCKDRLCGNRLNSVNGRNDDVPIYSYNYPFLIFVHFNGNEQADAGDSNRGFCFDYVQQPCSASITG